MSMIKISGATLDKTDKSLIRKYCHFVLDKFVKDSVQKKAIIKINIISKNDLDDEDDRDELKQYSAWCTHEGMKNGKRFFTITLNKSQINHRSKIPLLRLKKLLIDLGHELVHVKQYLNNEIFDYSTGDVRFMGKRFDASHYIDKEKYYFSPWEMAAYGIELGLYALFCDQVVSERNLKQKLKID